MLVSVSTDKRLNEAPTASRSMLSRSAASKAASVKMYASIVAMFGSIMPEPFATQVIVALPTRADNALGCVSVVMMPSAPTIGSSCNSLAIPTMPRSILSIGNGTPITPVELTRMRSAVVSNSRAAAVAMRRAFSTPAAPVATLLTLLFAMMPRRRPARMVSRPRMTGAPGK